MLNAFIMPRPDRRSSPSPSVGGSRSAGSGLERRCAVEQGHMLIWLQMPVAQGPPCAEEEAVRTCGWCAQASLPPFRTCLSREDTVTGYLLCAVPLLCGALKGQPGCCPTQHVFIK